MAVSLSGDTKMKELASILDGAIRVLLNKQTGEYSLFVHGDEFYTVSEKSKMRSILRQSYQFGEGMCERYQRACVELEARF